jgi:hypothetical protein
MELDRLFPAACAEGPFSEGEFASSGGFRTLEERQKCAAAEAAALVNRDVPA